MEELQARHRKEQRDLQSRITQKKKQATKKTRKGVDDECERLEADLKERQSAEIAGLDGGETSGHAEVGSPADKLDHLTLDRDEGQRGGRSSDAQPITGQPTPHEPNAESAAEPNNGQRSSKKPNRQKARLARRAAEQEEQAKEAREEAQNLPNRKEQERSRMLESMRALGLQEKEIRADGHCLYSAVADQLEQLDIPLGATPSDQPVVAYRVVRGAAAKYMEEHQDDFVPFLEEPLPDYLHKVKDTGEWGGQLELLALAKTYGVDINVMQDFGRVEKIESDGKRTDAAIWLGYYKHGFGLGEHYNSLRKVP